MINRRILGLVLSSGTVQLQGEYFGRLPSYTIRIKLENCTIKLTFIKSITL